MKIKYKFLIDRIGFFKEIRLLRYKDVYQKVKEMNITDSYQKKQHNRDKAIISEFRKQKNINKCPWCGSSLVVRNGRYGKFRCCSRYGCTYTENISN